MPDPQALRRTDRRTGAPKIPMPKNDFISDNLVNMRERLRQNTAAISAASAKEGEPVTAIAAETGTAPLSGRIIPRSDDQERIRRDLEGRILRDLAAARAELERLDLRREELRRFEQELAAEWERFSQLSPDGAGYAKQLDHLRLEYFRRAGAVATLLSGTAPSRAAEDAEPVTFQRRTAETLPLILAILAAALIVAFSTILTFRI